MLRFVLSPMKNPSILSQFKAWLTRDFNNHLTPELKRLERNEITLDIGDIEPKIEALEKVNGRAVLKLKTTQGFWPFIGSIIGSTRPQFWRTLNYMIIGTLITVVPPTLIEKIIANFELIRENPTHWGYLAMIIAFPASVYFHNVWFRRYIQAFSEAAVLQQSALTHAFLHKWFRMRPQTKHAMPQGNVQNLLSVDVPAVSHCVERFVDAGMVLLDILVITTLLWRYLGATTLASLALMTLSIPLVKSLIQKTRLKQGVLLGARDDRIDLLAQIISAIKVIKLSGWTEAFLKRSQKSRQNEVNKLWEVMLLTSRSSLVFNGAGIVVATLTYGLYLWNGGELTAAMFFPSLILFQSMERPFAVISDVATIYAQTQVSSERLIEFFNLPEETQPLSPAAPFSKDQTGPELTVRNLSVSPDAKGNALLKNLHFHLPAGKSLAIIGPVGAGKSLLLSTLLREVLPSQGEIHWSQEPRLAFCPQEPFIASGSLRDNLVFHSRESDSVPISEIQEAVEIAGLDSDIQHWPAGYLTEIGERGLNLSGGQKQRLSLARAILHRPSVALLDDPFSALDINTEDHVVESLLFSEWKTVTRICVTHRLTHLHRFDYVLFLDPSADEKNATQFGTFAQLEKSNERFLNFLRLETEGHQDHQLISKNLGAKNKILAEKEETLTNVESRVQGKIKSRLWRSILWRFGKSAWGNHPVAGATLMLGAVFIAGALPLFQQYWGSTSGSLSPRDFFTGFSIFTLAILLASFLSELALRKACLYTAQSAHDEMLTGVMRSPLRFFDVTPTGRLLNRFSSDIQQLDQELAARGNRFANGTAGTLAKMVGVCLAAPFALIPLGLTTFLSIGIARRYGVGVRENARLTSTVRSPMFTFFNECLRGWSTLRAFGCEQTIHRKTTEASALYLNTDMRRWSLYFWLSMRLSVISAVLLMSLIGICLGSTISAVTAGLILTFTYTLLGRIERVCRDFFALSQVLVPWERCQQWAELPNEESPDTIPPLRDKWPTHGEVDFRHARLRYAEGLPVIVENATFRIPAGTHAGLLGRTGAGKSTLLLGLLRNLHMDSGEIKIDGKDIHQVPLEILRRSIAYVPQDPILFLGPLRDSLDVLQEYDDDAIIEALKHVGLWNFVQNLPHGLQTPLEEGGKNISAGQRQLICLARAILLKTKIILMDEATANVDVESDALIRRAIQTQLKGTTILLIAHRPSSLSLCQMRILVEQGQTRVVHGAAVETLA